MSISLILDIAVAALLVLFTIVGVRRGFIKSVVRLLGFVVAVVGAAVASMPIAQYVYTTFFHTPIEAMVAQKVQEGVTAAATSLSEQVTAVLSSLPHGVQSLLAVYGVDGSHMNGATQTGEALVPTVMDGVITPLCTAVLQVIVFLVLFLVLFLIIRLLGKLIDKIFASLPVIKQVNGLLGGVLGFAEGVLVLFVLCFGLQLYMTLTGANSLLSTAQLEQTHLLGWAMANNPIL